MSPSPIPTPHADATRHAAQAGGGSAPPLLSVAGRQPRHHTLRGSSNRTEIVDLTRRSLAAKREGQNRGSSVHVETHGPERFDDAQKVFASGANDE